MKKSMSAPCLQNASTNITFANSKPMKKTTSTNALSAYIGNDITPIINIISNEIQLESVLHVPSSQLGICFVMNKSFPTSILDNESLLSIDKNMAECIVEPDPPEPETRDTNMISGVIRNPSYLDLCQICDKTAERYALHLRKLRQSRKKNM